MKALVLGATGAVGRHIIVFRLVRDVVANH